MFIGHSTSFLVDELNDWFILTGRHLPWRDPHCSAWGVLLSEVMSQQPPVARVEPAWREWVDRWPTPTDFARAGRDDVLRAWGRLGYPRRALRLHDCARTIVETHSGRVPDTVPELLNLPGIGEYTARAVACFAYGWAVPVVDTNIRRVIARAVHGKYLQGPARRADLDDMRDLMPVSDEQADVSVGAMIQRVRESINVATPTSREQSALSPTPQAETGTLIKVAGVGLGHISNEQFTDVERSAVFAASMMELGALVCTSRAARCDHCPLIRSCAWRLAGCPEPTETERTAVARRVQKFEGTDRQVRGAIMKVLRDAPGPVDRGAIAHASKDDKQLMRALQSLIDDGLVVERGEHVGLPQ